MSTQLTPLVFIALVVFTLAATISVYALVKAPRPPRALIEIATEKVLAAGFVAMYAVIFWNTDHGFPLFDQETAKVLGRLAPILFVAKPMLFILARITNWFRDRDDYIEASRRLSRYD